MSKIQPSQLEMYEFKRTILVAIQNGAQTRSDIAKEIGISDDLDLNHSDNKLVVWRMRWQT
jgi:hypothetical protein